MVFAIALHPCGQLQAEGTAECRETSHPWLEKEIGIATSLAAVKSPWELANSKGEKQGHLVWTFSGEN